VVQVEKLGVPAPWHWLPMHPFAHVVSVDAYVQAPPEHLPDRLYVRSVDEEMHVAWGGVVQTMGIPAQTPFAQVSPVVHALPSSHVAPFAYA
jgi:hypothetical protein